MIIQNLDAWDKREFNERIEDDYDVQRMEETGSQKVYNYAEFMRDVFGGLYKYAPQVRDIDEAPADEKWADSIYDEIQQLPEWKTLRERTKMNADAAAAATVKFCEQFVDKLPKTGKHRQTPSRSGENVYVNKNEGVIELNDLDMSAVRRYARDACEQATEEADKTNEMLAAFGYGTGDGRPQYASPTQKKEAAKMIKGNYHLQRIAELAGRMRRIASEKQKQKTKHGVDELADIKVGDDLARLIPAELGKLAHPLMKLDFQRKFLEKQLLQYELRGREREGRGPLVVCVDESGSMRGERDIWAKAVVMALLQIAQQQKRKFALIHFSGTVSRIDRFESRVGPAELIDAVAHFTGGGTDFEAPLGDAAQIICDEKDYNKADIVFITDDDCSISDSWLQKFLKDKKEFGFSVISVAIAAHASVCERFSDQTVYINDIRSDELAKEVMFSV